MDAFAIHRLRGVTECGWPRCYCEGSTTLANFNEEVMEEKRELVQYLLEGSHSHVWRALRSVSRDWRNITDEVSRDRFLGLIG
jgi:hypothetical protein